MRFLKSVQLHTHMKIKVKVSLCERNTTVNPALPRSHFLKGNVERVQFSIYGGGLAASRPFI